MRGECDGQRTNDDDEPIQRTRELPAIGLKDEGTGIDAGTDFRSRDLWVTVGGVEWRINIRRNKEQHDVNTA